MHSKNELLLAIMTAL